MVIAGGGLGGLTAALCLARDGVDVVLLEPDPPPGDLPPDDLARLSRPGAPQGRHPHNFMPLARRLLARSLPDVYATLLEKGAVEVDMRPYLPPGDADSGREEDLIALACRRPILEEAIRAAMMREQRVDVRAATAVDVVGNTVHTASEAIAGDLVVDAAGRRSPLTAALTARGEDVTVDAEDCGITYVARHYRLQHDTLPTPMLFGLTVRLELPYLAAALFLGDDRTFSVIVGTAPADRELRRALVDPARYDAALAQLPPHAPWVAPGVSVPVTDVMVMGGLANVVVKHGDLSCPYVAIGDAVLTTNPRLGWGASLAFLHVDLLRRHLAGGAADVAAATRAEILQDAQARWRASVEEDQVRIGFWTDGVWKVSPALRLGFAARTDRTVATSAARRVGLLDGPEDYLLQPGMHEALTTAEQQLQAVGPTTEPSREALLGALPR